MDNEKKGTRTYADKKPFAKQGQRKERFDRRGGGKRDFNAGGFAKKNENDDKRGFVGKNENGERRSAAGDRGEKRGFSGKKDLGGRRAYAGGDKRGFARGESAEKKSAQARAKGASPARVCALEALLAVGRAGAYSGLALDQVLRKHNLSDADRRLCTELFYGCLEKRLYLDYVLKPYLRRPFEDEVMDEILRMAVYQALFLDRIPENAICSEAVELVRLRGREALCPVTNGILRAFLRRESDAPMPVEPVKRLSLETSTPIWLIEAMMAQLGEEATQYFLRAGTDRRMTVRVSKLNWTMEALRAWLTEKGYEWSPSVLDDALRVKGGALPSSQPFAQGQYAIMGEASMLACRALGVKNGWRVLDACAAPGGKSCYIGELMSGTGRVTAMDIHPHRVELIGAYAKRMHLDNIRPRVADASRLGEELFETMDAVLVDAPCSGLGVLHNKPDIKYTTTPQQLEELPAMQQAILESAASTVKPGGVLVYSTCTVLDKENAQVVRAFLEKHPEFTLSGLEKHLPEAYSADVHDSMIRLMPDRNGTDGFFIARMVKAGGRR